MTATVNYATSNGTATAGSDYTAVTGILTFTPGITSQTFTVPTTVDAVFEGDETITLTLNTANGAGLGSTNNPATLTIVEDDNAPVVDFSSLAYSVNEGNATATITVTLSAASSVTATVNYATSNNTATAGSDYAANSGVLTFTPGIISQTFTVPITNDLVFEGNETVTLTLSGPTNATLVGATNNPAPLTIVDNDSAPQVQFSSATYSIDEDGGPAVITVTLSAASSVTATVNYATSNNTATAGSDYAATSGVLTFSPGITNQTFTVSITDDVLFEGNEALTLTLTTPVSASLGSPSAATLTIIEDDAVPIVGFSSASYSVNENAGTATITVTLSSASVVTATVNYTSSDNTATAGSDYTAAGGTLTFTPGITSRTFTVPIINDVTIEGNEVLSLTLSSAVSATIGLNPAALTIVDDDVPAVDFSSVAYSVNENTGSATITVTLSGVSPLTATVDYSTADNTATAASDYTAVSGTLTFTPGLTSRTFSVPITDDALFESNETVRLNLSNGINATLGATNNPATLTILDNDNANAPEVQFSSATYSVAENSGPAVITVTLSTVSGVTATVNYATSNNTATAGSDYTATSGILTFSPGITSQTVSVPITNDGVFEGNETLSLTLSSTISASLGSPSAATLTILEDESSPTLDFSSAAYSVNEASGPAVITVTLSPASAVTTTVNYASSDNTATTGSDYSAASGLLTFAPGVTSQTFTVPIINDAVLEPDETITLTLSSAVNAAIGLNPATLTILNDDATPQVDFSSATYSVNEGAGSATITVTLSAASSFTATIDYVTAAGSATAGSDYTDVSGTLTFTPGVTSLNFTVSVTDDALYESSETITLTLSSPVSATIGSNNPAVLTIVDNDTPIADFSSATYSVDETANTATITVTLSTTPTLLGSVNYATSDNTATAGSDYSPVSSTLTLTPGQTTYTFTVSIIDDLSFEGNEALTLTLSSPINAALGSANNPARLTIVDNDPLPTVDYSSSTYSVNEAGGTATITVTLSAASSVTATVNYATSNNTATAGSDYVTTSGILTFTPGITAMTFSVPITNDLVFEGNETVTLTLSGVSQRHPRQRQ